VIRLTKIDHVCLWVRSLAESRQYYEALFGLSCKVRDNDPATLVVESDAVHFFMQEARADADFLELQHLSFAVESLSQVIDNLDEMGISDYRTGQVECFAHQNYKWCEWRDPSGIRLECVELF